MIKTTSNTQNQLGKICRFLKKFFFCDRRKRVSVVYENMLCCSNLPVSGMRTGFRYVHLRTNNIQYFIKLNIFINSSFFTYCQLQFTLWSCICLKNHIANVDILKKKKVRKIHRVIYYVIPFFL